jgi:hypothetical protein
MIPLLDELAHQVLDLKQYARLEIVAGLLSMFSRGAWTEIEDDVKVTVLAQIQKDLHVRAWDDWDWGADGAFSRINTLVAAEQKGMTRKSQ